MFLFSSYFSNIFLLIVRYSSVNVTSPDFVKLAKIYGINGYTAQQEEEIEINDK